MIKQSLLLFLILVSFASPALAKCVIDNQEVPCSEFWNQFGQISIVIFGSLILFWFIEMGFLLINAMLSKKIKKNRPDLLNTIEYFNPIKTIPLTFKTFLYQFTLGFFNKKRTEKQLSVFIKIDKLKKLNNSNLNHNLNITFKLYKVLGIGMAFLIGLILYGIIFL